MVPNVTLSLIYMMAISISTVFISHMQSPSFRANRVPFVIVSPLPRNVTVHYWRPKLYIYICAKIREYDAKETVEMCFRRVHKNYITRNEREKKKMIIIRFAISFFVFFLFQSRYTIRPNEKTSRTNCQTVIMR